MHRRSFATAFLLSVKMLIDATIGYAGDPRTSAPDNAVVRSLNFLRDDATAWKSEHGCVSCHHAALTVWVMEEAISAGYTVDQDLLADLKTWIASSGNGTTSLERPPGIPKALNTKAVYFLLALGAVRDPDKEIDKGIQQLLPTVVNDQLENGSWAAWPETRPPMFGNSDDSMSALAMLSLLPLATKNKAAKESLENGKRWLIATPTDGDPQSMALRLLIYPSLGLSSESCADLAQSIVSRQNTDGGWSQAAGIPSDAWATGQALAALASIELKDTGPILRGREFLKSSQRDDGAWTMTSRPAGPGNVEAKNLVPITAGGTAWATLGLIRSQFLDR